MLLSGHVACFTGMETGQSVLTASSDSFSASCQVLASERDPDAAWSKVAALQQAAVAPKKTAKPKKPAPPPASSAPTDMDIDGGALRASFLIFSCRRSDIKLAHNSTIGSPCAAQKCFEYCAVGSSL